MNISEAQQTIDALSQERARGLAQRRWLFLLLFALLASCKPNEPSTEASRPEGETERIVRGYDDPAGPARPVEEQQQYAVYDDWYNLLYELTVFPPLNLYPRGRVTFDTTPEIIEFATSDVIAADVLADGDEESGMCFQGGSTFRWSADPGSAGSKRIVAVWFRTENDYSDVGEDGEPRELYAHVAFNSREFIANQVPLLPRGDWGVLRLRSAVDASDIEIVFSGASTVCLTEIRLSRSDDPWLRYSSNNQHQVRVSRCGDPEFRANGVRPADWRQFSCQNVPSWEGRRRGCRDRYEYTSVAGNGCPGDELCCPAADDSGDSSPPPTLETHCGDPSFRPDDVQPSSWESFGCYSRPRTGRSSNCKARAEYTPIAGMGCPTGERCCTAPP